MTTTMQKTPDPKPTERHTFLFNDGAEVTITEYDGHTTSPVLTVTDPLGVSASVRLDPNGLSRLSAAFYNGIG